MSIQLMNPLNGNTITLQGPLTEVQILDFSFKAMKVFGNPTVNESLEGIGGFLNLNFLSKYQGLFEFQLLSDPQAALMDRFEARGFILEVIRAETIHLVPGIESQGRYTRIRQGELDINSMINLVKISQGNGSSLFGAIGCGLGLVVVAAALSSKFQYCFGFDSEPDLAAFHDAVIDRAAHWSQFFGLNLSPIRLITDDLFRFEYEHMILQSETLFLDNFSFSVELNHKLEALLFELNPNALLISSKSFQERRCRRNSRSVGNLSYILDLEGELVCLSAWSAQEFVLYVQKINGRYQRARLEWLEKQN